MKMRAKGIAMTGKHIYLYFQLLRLATMSENKRAEVSHNEIVGHNQIAGHNEIVGHNKTAP